MDFSLKFIYKNLLGAWTQFRQSGLIDKSVYTISLTIIMVITSYIIGFFHIFQVWQRGSVSGPPHGLL
jgi:hypothetical protein